jgi:transcriptional regulator
MITYDYYRIFYYVAQYKSFTRAAEALHNNQPNITRCMNNLESELNCTLFLRSNKGITLTPEGKRLYEHVAIAYEQLSLGEDEIRQNRDLENGLVSIGASENALRLLLLPVLERFHEQYPHVRIRIFNHSTPQAILALESKVVDFAAVTSPLTIQKPLHKTHLASYREILIGGTKYKELASQIRSLNDLSGIPVIGLADGTGTRELYHRYFLSHGLMFAPDMEAATTDQILPMITHNLGIGFYPEELAAEAIARSSAYAIRLVEPIPEREICLVTNSSTQMSAAVRKVISFL